MAKSRPYLWSFGFLFVAMTLSVVIGSVLIPLSTLGRMFLHHISSVGQTDWPAAYETIVFQVRLPHMVLVLLTGAGLGGSGAAYQGLFRNPLADPYLIGVASGAGLGAVIAMALRWPVDVLGFFTIPAFAFFGALLTVMVVYVLAQVNRTLPTTTLILAGVAVSSFTTAATSFLLLASANELYRALSWLLGGGTIGGWSPVGAMLPYILVGLGYLITTGHQLNVLQFGDEQAHQLGIPVERVKRLILVAATLTTAAAVAFSGLIGFIGLIVPHMVRIVYGPDYRHLVPLSIIGGGVALLLADAVARSILAPQTLPVGIITALAGAPFFLWILRTAKSNIHW